MVEGRVIEVKSIQELATMPSREELLAQVLFLIKHRRSAWRLRSSGVARNLAVVVDQGVKENKFSAKGHEFNRGVQRTMADINAIAEQIQGLDAARSVAARQRY